MKANFLLASAALLLLGACSGSSTSPGATGAKSEFPNEPALTTDQATLDNNLHCTDFTHPDKPPVLLVHGTFTSGQEQYEWNYIPLLAAKGFDVCAVTYPDRGLGDQQISAEYVVNALRRMYAKTGRKVAMIGHSQGASMPRWALMWWPSARNAVQDFVLEAGPNHGTTQVSSLAGLVPANLPVGLVPEAFYQFEPDSNFTKAVNAGGETPGDIDYTTLYGAYDELVQPVTPVPTAALDWQQNNPHVSNILLQDVCPGYVVDHVTIGTTDALAFALALDAISNPGPANVARAGGAAKLCNNLLPLLPQENVGDYTVTGLVQSLEAENASAIPNLHLAAAEPPLMSYATAAAAQ
ncbi:MAG: esterase/lipase family protein [Stenotrophobium sp.]